MSTFYLAEVTEMMQHMRIWIIWAVLAIVLAPATQADGAGPYLGGSWWYPPANVYVRDQIPPYFALHPPVYYSYPVARTYGYSPYAYPPGTKTPELFKPQPVVIRNQFVPSKPTTKPDRDQIAQAPLRIANPYVSGLESRPVQADLGAAAQRPRPHVVLPMAAVGRP